MTNLPPVIKISNNLYNGNLPKVIKVNGVVFKVESGNR